MTGQKRDWATGLGRLIRALGFLATWLLWLVAVGLVVWGVWGINSDVAKIVAGTLGVLVLWPRAERRK